MSMITVMVTVAYILLIMAGIVWLVYKISMYIQNERDRDSRLEESSIYDDQFRNYVETLKKQKSKNEAKPPEGTPSP